MVESGTALLGKRSVVKRMSMLAAAGVCAVSWVAGSALGAVPAHASTCLPYGNTCAPDDFTGEASGTLLADLVQPFSVSGAFSGTYVTAVYLNAGGTLDFYSQVSNDSGSTNAITQLNVSDFQGARGDMGDRSDGSTLSGTPFVDGTQIPVDVTRGSNGDPVTWDFTGSNAVNLLPPGDTSTVVEVKTNATNLAAGTITLVGGGTYSGSGFQPVVTPMSSSATPTNAHTGTVLNDSATLSAATTPDGTGKVTFNLYGPGDTTCSASIDTEVVTGINGDGPWTTPTGYVAGLPGTYNWVASFSGDSVNGLGSTYCGQEPVVVTRPAQITHASSTCSQFAAGTASSLSKVYYKLAGGRITAVTPSAFSYWAAITSTGAPQTFKVDQFTNETSRPFKLASGSSVYTAGCSTVASLMSQSGGAVTVNFTGGTAGEPVFIGLNFSTSAVVGEAKPQPSGTVHYLFKSSRSEVALSLVK